MDKLIDIVNRAIEDYGFRQIAQWSPEDVVEMWDLTNEEAGVLTGPIKMALDMLPIPVEPDDYISEKARFRQIIDKALRT
tara:strand:+ start:620 stop:859 length:240 start_codon:yes stop_codon:yes gene_type:complete